MDNSVESSAFGSPNSISSAKGARNAAPQSPPPNESDSSPHTEISRRIHLTGVASDRETLLRGKRAFDRGEDDAALASFERLAAHGIRFADVHYMLGLLRERRGQTEEALTHLTEALRINPSYVEALLALASLHESQGDYAKSQGYAERASQLSQAPNGGLDPTTRGKLSNQQAALADALAEAGERRSAIEEYRCALDRCPTFHDIRHRLGIVLREAGLPAQAAAEFKHILRAHPGLLDSQVQLGLTYYSIGRTADALEEWDAVLQKEPGRTEARMYLRLVRGPGQNANAPESRVGKSSPENPAPAVREDLSFARVESVHNSAPRRSEGWSKTELAGAHQSDDRDRRDGQDSLEDFESEFETP